MASGAGRFSARRHGEWAERDGPHVGGTHTEEPQQQEEEEMQPPPPEEAPRNNQEPEPETADAPTILLPAG